MEQQKAIGMKAEEGVSVEYITADSTMPRHSGAVQWCFGICLWDLGPSAPAAGFVGAHLHDEAGVS